MPLDLVQRDTDVASLAPLGLLGEVGREVDRGVHRLTRGETHDALFDLRDCPTFPQHQLIGLGVLHVAPRTGGDRHAHQVLRFGGLPLDRQPGRALLP